VGFCVGKVLKEHEETVRKQIASSQFNRRISYKLLMQNSSVDLSQKHDDFDTNNEVQCKCKCKQTVNSIFGN
jgi:FixJ family two-component response regulator